MDQRVENTYTALQGSMRELLGTTTWDKITVQSLCQCAGLSRTTFYTHFKHKDDLLDSLLIEFEKAMRADNNGRSLADTGTFKFLPILLNHVNGNRLLFAKTNGSVEGYPVALKFKELIARLVDAELDEACGEQSRGAAAQHFVVGGIYNALVQWSETTNDETHLKILNEIDSKVKKLL